MFRGIYERKTSYMRLLARTRQADTAEICQYGNSRRLLPRQHSFDTQGAVREKILSLLKDAADSGMTAFAGLYSSSVSDHNEFRRQGAALTFSLPCSLVSLCKSILIRAGSRNTLLSQMEIFLEGTGMPRKLKGFGCLADISVLCLESPERLWGGIMGIYEETAGKLSVNASQVERAVRNLGDHAAQNGAISRLTEGRLSDRPNNTELICAVCDGFTRR